MSSSSSSLALAALSPSGPRWRLTLSPRQWLGCALLLALVLFALWPLVAGGASPLKQNLRFALQGPSAADWFGYDHLGRSMQARLSAALRLSMGMALACVASAMAFGVLLGVVAAWSGGLVDRLIGAVSEALLALPGLLLVLMLTAIAPNNVLILYLGIALVFWIEYFRVTRALARPVLQSPAVEASRLLGFGPLYILRRHIWPELAPILLPLSAARTAYAVMAIASLGFVSVGVRPPTPELGAMMIELQPYYEEAPHALLQPIAALFLMVLALQLMGGKGKP
jgi:peptide/nickel transport system permease protein